MKAAIRTSADEMVNGLVATCGDIFSVIGVCASYPGEDNFKAATRKNLPKYEEFVRLRYFQSEADAIMRHSLATKVSQLDGLVMTFNADRERIRQADDYLALQELWRQARIILPHAQ